LPLPRTADHLASFLENGGSLILDGGFATELERTGFDLNHPLWSARLLREDPEAIRRLHLAYLEAGADCITSASYQASLPGFAREGLSRDTGLALLRHSVELAWEAREAFWSNPGRRGGRHRPLVAASIGPYGAYLANGAEYTGAYDIGEAGLFEFHHERLNALADAGADLLACETLPSAVEARVLCRLLEERPFIPAWLSFSARDGERISDGTPFTAIVRELAPRPAVAAIGVNCTAPRYVESLLRAAAGHTDKPLVAYPNSGERYDGQAKVWRGESSADDWGTLGRSWRDAGARLLGGCCRTGPDHVRSLRASLSQGAEGWKP
jgi:homocysteine S-methyltransferase